MRIVIDIVIVLTVSLAWDILCRFAGLNNEPLELAVRSIPPLGFGFVIGWRQ